MSVFKKLLSILTGISILFFFSEVSAQKPVIATSADIYQSIKKLNVLGSAMYIAAHPDDENTRLISYLSNHLNIETTYLSMTRGGGGQNLIGPEIRELLGVMRTQELLAARRIDGGNQMFTRANDFGYSKTPDETLEIWNRELILSDVILAIRKLKPDIIINRFPHYHLNGNHGHHTSSAMLSFEAFDLAADENQYPEHLKIADPWAPSRLFFNTSWWFYGSREKFAEADKSKLAMVDVGVYYPTKGKSNTEIAAESRSMHKCQGFGAAGSRGNQLDYLELQKGEMPENLSDLFEGIDISWNRLNNGHLIEPFVLQIEKMFDHQNPGKSIPDLIRLKHQIEKLEESYWKNRKLEEVKSIILQCAGLFAEAVATDFSASPGDSIPVSFEIVNRSDIPIRVDQIYYRPGDQVYTINQSLGNNESFSETRIIHIPSGTSYTDPYWLRETGKTGYYTIEDINLRGLPELESQLGFHISLDVLGENLKIELPIIHKVTDPVKAEIYRPFEVTPPVFANISNSVIVFAGQAEQKVEVIVKAGKKDVAGNLSLEAGAGWSISPDFIPFTIQNKGDEQRFEFKVSPPEFQDISNLSAFISCEGKVYDKELIQIDYDHIPAQIVLRKSSSKIVNIDLKKEGESIGYIEGAGDQIPESLRQIGYNVDIVDPQDIDQQRLKKYDAVILGIRAFNTKDQLKHKTDELFKYVEEGGNLIVQYNTSRGNRIIQL
jgi:LmbE family N-acetylglucosaminyl deacetylase